MSSAYFISDIHLRSADEPNAKKLIRFLDSLAQGAPGGVRATYLFLVGDIFDLWVGSHAYFREKFAAVIDAVERVVKSGIEVHFFEGNHDLYLQRYWCETLGVHVYSGPEYFQIAGQTVRVEHGDQMNPDDRGYLFLRALLRTPAVKMLAHTLPSWLVRRIGESASAASRRRPGAAMVRSRDPAAEEIIRGFIRTHALQAVAEKPFDLLISGHVHLLDDAKLQAGGKAIRSVNLGSWFESARAFVLDEARAEFVSIEIFGD